MSYNLGAVITRVQNRLDDNSFDSQMLIDFANDTQREFFNHYRVNTMEQQNDTITTTEGSRDLSNLPGTVGSTIGQYISLRIILPVNYSRVIPYVDYEDADVYYPNYNLLGEGPPLAWFIFDGVPTLLNRADKTYTISAKYTVLPTTLSSTSDVPTIPEENSEILVEGMLARAHKFNDEYDKAAIDEAKFMKLCADFVDQTRRTAGTPHVMRRPLDLRRNLGIR